ncbi:MAG: hypothetical protein WC600_11430 [Desulfobaccales bacterium]
MKPKLSRERTVIIEPEEYDALMAELPTTEVELKSPSEPAQIDEKFRKIEFYMMIIVGLILLVLILCKQY